MVLSKFINVKIAFFINVLFLLGAIYLLSQGDYSQGGFLFLFSAASIYYDYSIYKKLKKGERVSDVEWLVS